ncbi:UNVERIFIED_CONTAM: hypothetical protein RMT77_007342 [Armadillidium vulgare]
MYGTSVYPIRRLESVENFDNVKMSVMPTGGSSKDLNINRYATKKTIAQGMLDIALLTANASQLRYVLGLGEQHEFYEIMLGLIITSITLQVLVGILFLIIGIIDINEPENHFSANILNNIAVVLIFIISVMNIIINAFGIRHSNNNSPGSNLVLKKR